MTDFAPTLAAAEARIAAVRPADYAASRNRVDGAVSGLSPYITHGFVTLPEVLAGVAAACPLALRHTFVFQLGWREYFRHRWARLGDGPQGLLHSLHPGPLPDAAYARELPADIRQARTGVPVIDTAVRRLYATGMLHNHARLWLASYVVHLRKVHWRVGADWLIAHLLDGDLASNHLSWQWVAGTGSHKPYLFNADNVARFAPAEWHSPASVLDTSYERLDALARDPSACDRNTCDRNTCDGDAGDPNAVGVAEPVLGHRPPDGPAGAPVPTDALARIVAGRRVQLVHPWALREQAPPTSAAVDDGAAPDLRLGIYLTDFHDAWPWSQRRWHFVAQRMAAITDACWVGDAAALQDALHAARSVHSIADPHLPWLATLAACTPAPTLFAEVQRDCASFSQWWPLATVGMQGLAAAGADRPQPAPSQAKPHDNPDTPTRPGHRRARWHRP